MIEFLEPPIINLVLYPFWLYRKRYFDSFRRQPAITRLDKPFTPNLISSKALATATGSPLHSRFRLDEASSPGFGPKGYNSFLSLSVYTSRLILAAPLN